MQQGGVMSSATLERKDGAWLDGHAHDWVAAGLISADQAESIRHFEHLDEPAEAQRLTVVAEVASYLGSVIAFAGGAAIVGPNWEQLGTVGQLVLACAIAAVGFAVGTWLVHLAEPGTERLGWFLWVVGAGGLGIAAAVITNAIDPRDGAWYSVAIGLPLVVVGVGLWRNLDRPLQLLTGAVGVLVASAGLKELTGLSPWVAASTLWAVSLAFGLLAARDVVRPRLTALVIAAAGLMIGSILVAPENERFSAIAAVLSAALIVAYALHDRSWPLVGIGLFAFLVSTVTLMQTVLHSMGARLVAVLVGLAVVAYVAMRAQRTGAEAQMDRAR